MLVDFHVHSTASDGTLALSELAAQASSRNFAALALTDHDNCDGVRGFLDEGKDVRPHIIICGLTESTTNHSLPPTLYPLPSANFPLPTTHYQLPSTNFISGIELSIEPGEGFDRFHLLGLGIDPNNAGLKDFLRRVLDGRNARNKKIFENFHRLGIDIKPESHGEVLARPHFARWLVEHGYATGKADAFAKYLLPESPAETRCYEERYHPSQEEAFRVVHAAGGICVMAHPKFWRNSWKYIGCDFALADRALAALKEKGLDGVEALYEANAPAENAMFTRLADKYGYVKTAGSDFHGSNKPDIALGMEVSERFIAPLFERLNI